ncbi:hypothetical protein D3C76_1724480 [compost metagenome]
MSLDKTMFMLSVKKTRSSNSLGVKLIGLSSTLTSMESLFKESFPSSNTVKLVSFEVLFKSALIFATKTFGEKGFVT